MARGAELRCMPAQQDDWLSVQRQLAGDAYNQALLDKRLAHDRYDQRLREYQFMNAGSDQWLKRITAERERIDDRVTHTRNERENMIRLRKEKNQLKRDIRASRHRYMKALKNLREAEIVCMKARQRHRNLQRSEFARHVMLARKAGVAEVHFENMKVTEESDVIHFYFGGRGRPDGLYHGHYILTDDGYLLYRRDPGEPHGPQNHHPIPAGDERKAV